MRKYLVIAAAVGLAGCVSTSGPERGSYPNPALGATYGTVTLTAGSSLAVAIDAGGYINAYGTVSSACRGFIYDAPDFVLNYQTNGNATLSLNVQSSTDTTLVVYTPDGTWLCDDDAGGGLNPLLRIARARPGSYAIWVGTYESEPYVRSTLRVN